MTTPKEFNKWASERNIKTLPMLYNFSVGDTVTYTNEFGASFENHKIIGIDESSSFYGRHFYLDKDSYWFPVKLKEIKKQ